MQKITKIIILFCLLSSNFLFAQIARNEVVLNKQIEKSSLVIEGKVISKVSYWDNMHRYIYTVNTVKVYKVFKGKPIKTIDIITLGGVVGLKALKASSSLNLQKEDVGLFNLINSDIQLKSTNKINNKQFRPYSSTQGFYKYNLQKDIAVNSFSIKKGISPLFYNEIMNLTKVDYIEIENFNVVAKYKNSFSTNSITFSPTISTSGTKSVLTINGLGFGTVKGKVSFSNADDGGLTYTTALNTQVLSWNDTEIKVEIPSKAGTGQIQITNNNDLNFVSTQDLVITYSEFNIESDDVPTKDSGTSYAYQTQHISTNNLGGYIWHMQTDFFNDIEFLGAKAAFKRAMKTWRCTSGINWVISDSPSPIDDEVSTIDGVNVIRFDNGDELDEDVLGICYSWYSGCITNGSNAQWFVKELDIVFNDDTRWYFGTGEPRAYQYDFETVALHELGHGHQLGHVINRNEDAMHFVSFNGDYQRNLGANNIEATTMIQQRSTTTNVCSENRISIYKCDSSGGNEKLENLITIFPIPAKDVFYIKNETDKDIDKVIIFDIRGKLIKQYQEFNNLENGFNINNESSGVYFVQLHLETDVISKKLLIK